MKLGEGQNRLALRILVVLSVAMLPALAQSNAETGKLKVHVSPKQAYVFVDGKAIRDSVLAMSGEETMALRSGSLAFCLG